MVSVELSNFSIITLVVYRGRAHDSVERTEGAEWRNTTVVIKESGLEQTKHEGTLNIYMIQLRRISPVLKKSINVFSSFYFLSLAYIWIPDLGDISDSLRVG